MPSSTFTGIENLKGLVSDLQRHLRLAEQAQGSGDDALREITIRRSLQEAAGVAHLIEEECRDTAEATRLQEATRRERKSGR